MRVSAIVPAAGKSTRVGLPQRKQLWEVGGKPLLRYTLESLMRSFPFQEVAVAVPPDLTMDQKRFLLEVSKDKIRFVFGGESRHLSILAALKDLTPCDVVVIHDGVRPFVTKDVLARVVEAAWAYGAAGCVMPLIDTVVRPDAEGFLSEVLPRQELVASQTPQAFRYEILMEAYQRASKEELETGTECLKLALACGSKVRLVAGDSSLWKVTYLHDLFAAEALLRLRARETALVTGGSSGIGKEVARLLASSGVKVAVLGRSFERLAEFAAKIKGIAVQCDVSYAHEVEQAFSRVLQEWGRLDIVVNNAGIAELAPLDETSDSCWDKMVQVNLSGSFYVLRTAMKVMKRQKSGVIVNVLSSSVRGGRAGQGAYAATKAGLLALTETAAIEARPYGVDVFGIAPARTDTPLRRKLYPEEDPGELLHPSRVAEIIVFCCLQRLTPLSGHVFWVRRPS